MAIQSVDLSVSKAKYDREIDEFRQLEDEYRRRGWLLLQAEFPRVLVVLAAPQLKPPAIVTGVAFDYTNYDAEPPSVKLVDPFTGIPYLDKELPTRLTMPMPIQQIPFQNAPGAPMLQFAQEQPLMVAHAPDDVPFLCTPGVREYHEHPAHTGDSWHLHRTTGAGRLVRILDLVYSLGVVPLKGYKVNLQPQISL